MSKKADFNAEEWTTLVEAPLMAGARVVTAGRGGTIRESLAMGKVYAEARRQHGDSELLDELVASPPALDANRVQGMGNVADAASQRLHDAIKILEEKSPEDVEAYRQFVTSLAQAAANAHREGGVLGVGGQRISEDEQTALDEIAAAMQTPPQG